MYYVDHKFPKFSRVVIHLGTHAHLIANGKCRKSFQDMKNMIVNEVCRVSTAITSAIVLSTNKIFLSCYLFNEDGEGVVEFFKGEKLDQTLFKFSPLCSLGICTLIVSLKHCRGNSGSIDCILKLKALSSYNYIQNNCFLSQQVGQKVYLFKIFIDGIVFKFDLVWQIQPSDDMQNAWVMFNHVKCVQAWMTMACHVYNIVYCKVMIIASYDMQFKDT